MARHGSVIVLFLLLIFQSCEMATTSSDQSTNSVVGTWKLSAVTNDGTTQTALEAGYTSFVVVVSADYTWVAYIAWTDGRSAQDSGTWSGSSTYTLTMTKMVLTSSSGETTTSYPSQVATGTISGSKLNTSWSGSTEVDTFVKQ